jgi:hypothetical protein
MDGKATDDWEVGQYRKYTPKGVMAEWSNAYD